MNSAVDIGPDRAGWTCGLPRTRRRLGAVAALRLALMGTLALGFAWMGAGGAGRAWAGPAEVGLDGAVTGGADLSLRNEVEHALERGLSWLMARQGTNGAWGTNGDLRVTAAVVSALAGEPTGRVRTNAMSAMQRAVAFLTNAAQADGSFRWAAGGADATAAVVTSLALLRRSEDAPGLRRGREYLLRTLRAPTAAEAGLMMEVARIEAVRSTDYLVREGSGAEETGPDWSALVRRLETFQVGAGTAAGDAAGAGGGFVELRRERQAPGTAAGGDAAKTSPTETPTMRATAAGLLGLGYVRVPREDRRVPAALDWLGAHIRWEENAVGESDDPLAWASVATKALTLLGVETLPMPGGRSMNWRREWALGLLNLQGGDGAWVSRFGGEERDPCLATAGAVLALDLIWRGL